MGVIRSQNEFEKRQLCLTNLISFYDKITCLLGEGKGMNFVYLSFSKTFDNVLGYSPGEPGCSWLGQVYEGIDRVHPLIL